MEIAKKILNVLGANLVSLLIKLVDAIKSVFGYLDHNLSYKEQKEAKKEEKKEKDEIKDICDHGSLDDLFDKFTRVSLVFLSFSFIAGCISTNDVDVQVTKQWEGHYLSEKDFYKATREIELEKNESIWVLSNRSLNRVLNSQRNNKK